MVLWLDSSVFPSKTRDCWVFLIVQGYQRPWSMPAIQCGRMSGILVAVQLSTYFYKSVIGYDYKAS
jgi:hypothetical protein